jgi:hypothetical protein
MYYGDSTKDLRIKYHSDRPKNSLNHKNNFYIGGVYYNFRANNDWQNVIIGLNLANYSYRNVIIGNRSGCDRSEVMCIGTESVTVNYSKTAGFYAQTNGLL